MFKKLIYSLILLVLFTSCYNNSPSLNGYWYLYSSDFNDDIGYMELEIVSDSVNVILETQERTSSFAISEDSLEFLDFRGTYEFLQPDTLILNDQFGGTFRFIRFEKKELSYLSTEDLFQIRRFMFYSNHLEDDKEIDFIKADLWDRFKNKGKEIDFDDPIEIEPAID